MIRLAVRVPRERAEVVLAELLELAPAGVEERDLDVENVEYAVYGPPGELPALPDLRALAGGAPVEISTTEIADDWNERWRDFHKPVVIAAPVGEIEHGNGNARSALPSLRVRPPWEPASPPTAPAGASSEQIELVVDPGQAFGTGAHASTRLCLGLLLALLAERGAEHAVLDVGTGSGVLAIAAGKLGFGPLLGLDNEPESVAAAVANAEVNEVDLAVRRYDLRADPLPWLGCGAAPDAPHPERVVVLANLLRPLLVELAGAIVRAPAALIAGGLLAKELDEIAALFGERHGLSERRRQIDGEWGALWLDGAR